VTLLQVAGIPVALPVPAAETVVAPQDAVLPAMATGQAPILQDIAPGTVIATEIRQPGGIGETFGPKTGFQLQPGTTPPAAGPEATDTIPGAPPDVAAETAPPVRPTSDDAPVAPMTAVAVDPVAAAVAVPVAAPASAPAVTLPTEPKPGDSLPDTAAHQPGPAGLYSRPVAKAETELPPRPADSLAAAATPEVVSAPGAERAAPQQRADAVLEDLDSDGAGDSGRALPSQADSGAGAPVAAQQPATSHAVTPGGTARSAQPLETQLSLADRIRFVHRVEQAFQDLRGDGGTIRMRLSPPELGSLRLEIKVLNGELTARVETDTPSARNLLLDNLPALRDRLAQHDIKVQRFDIDLMDRSGGGPANQSPQYQNPSPQNGGAVPRAPARTAAEPAAAVATPPARPIGDGGRLNVIV
jgi:flagellar hook-length control protein FliK